MAVRDCGAQKRHAGNTTTEAWAALAATNERREHTAVVALDGNIYVLGGRWQSIGALTSVEVYDSRTDTWQSSTPMTIARSGHAAAVVGGRIVVLGGEVLGPRRDTLDSVEIYDPMKRRWEKAPPLPLALHGVPAAAINNHLYILGGSARAAAIENRGQVFKRAFVPAAQPQ